MHSLDRLPRAYLRHYIARVYYWQTCVLVADFHMHRNVGPSVIPVAGLDCNLNNTFEV